jgi:hypothetical protein
MGAKEDYKMKRFLLLFFLFSSFSLYAEGFKPGRYVPADETTESWINYLEFREEGVLLISATLFGITVVQAGSYKIKGSMIDARDGQNLPIVFDIQKDGSIIGRSLPLENEVFVRERQ